MGRPRYYAQNVVIESMCDFIDYGICDTVCVYYHDG